MKDLNSIYRPKKWSDIKGQEKITEMLKKQALMKKGLSNAYIFSGPSGVGKTTIARLFFMSLNCKELDKDANPCFKCDSCKNTQYGLREVNASDTRGIDDIRELIKDMQYTTQYGTYQGVLLDEAHMLTKPAWNCVLKPLEEAKASGVWLMCTTELFTVPKTIQTRSQVFKLQMLSFTVIFQRIKEISTHLKITIKDDDIWLIARNSDYNLRQAVHFLEQYVVTEDITKVLSQEIDTSFLESLNSSNYNSLYKIMYDWKDKATDINVFLNAIKYDLANCLKLKMGIVLSDVSPYRIEKYKKLLETLTEEKLINALNIFMEIQEKVSGIYDYNSLFLNALCKIKKIK